MRQQARLLRLLSALLLLVSGNPAAADAAPAEVIANADPAILGPLRQPDAATGFLQLRTSLNAPQNWLQVAVPDQARFVAIENASLHPFDLYFVQNRQILRRYLSGATQPNAARAEDFPGFLFKIPEVEGPLRMLIRQHKESALDLYPVQFLDEQSFLTYVAVRHLKHGAFYSILLIAAIFALAGVFTLGNGEHFAFGSYCIAMMLLAAVLDGFLQHYLLPDSPRLMVILIPLATLVAIVAQVQLTRRLLATADQAPGLDRALRWSIVPAVLIIGAVMLADTQRMATPLAFTGAAYCLWLMGAAGYGAWRQLPFAWVQLASIGLLTFTLLFMIVALSANRRLMTVLDAGMLGVLLQVLVFTAQRARSTQQIRARQNKDASRQRLLLDQVRQLSMAAEDGTELRAMRRSLQHQHRLRTVGKIAAGVAHDFNNILTSISGFSELLQQKGDRLTAAQRERYIGQIRLATDRGASLVRQLNTYSRHSRPRLANQNLSETLERTARLIKSSVPPGIRVKVDIGPDVIQCRIDPEQVEQMVSNLAFNACEAMEGTGTLRLGLAEADTVDAVCTSCLRQIRGGRVVITVADSGPGIAGNPADLFTPFETGTNDGTHSGLGLSVVHGIVHEHGGHLVMENERNQGCQVAVMLPRPSNTTDLGVPAVNQVLVLRPEEEESPLDLTPLEQQFRIEIATQRGAAIAHFMEYQQSIRLVLIDAMRQTNRWLELATDMREVSPDTPLLVLDRDLLRGDAEQLNELARQGGRLLVANPDEPGWSLLAAVNRLLESDPPTPAEVRSLLDSWRASR